MRITWPDGQTSSLRFQDCHLLEASMNFGMVAPESILTASEDPDGDLLRTVRENWSKRGVDLPDLRCFRIKTNSTASTIRVGSEER